jgi:glucose/arabinose dehydrogenase
MRKVLIPVVIFAVIAAIVVAAFWLVLRNNIEANEMQMQTAVAATVTAIENTRREPAPALEFPADGAAFDNVAEVRLRWRWLRPLEDGEVYDVRVWREGEPAYGITWTEEPEFDLTEWLLFQEPGTFYWSIAALQPGENDQHQEISEVSATRSFIMTEIDLRIMQLPRGFESNLYARLPFARPTVITFGADDNLYVLGLQGEIARLIDADGDHVAEVNEILFDDPDDELIHNVGMAINEETGDIYVSHATKISILRDENGDGTLDDIDTIIDELPSWEYPLHSNNGLAFGPDGKLYIAVGSTTDHGPIRRELEASILRADPDGDNLEIFATGFRNPYDIVFSPNGDLFSADNSPDSLNDTLQYLPPEELNHVREGQHYGFPDVFGFPSSGEASEPPVTEFFTSSATSGLTFYAADQFPAAYQGVYVAQFGTGAAYPESRGVNNGKMVVHVALEPTADGTFTGTWRPFARFDNPDLGNFSPIDVTVGSDGALYIAEFETATIYRITHTGEDVAAAPATPELITDAEPEVVALGEDVYHNGRDGAPPCMTCHLLDNQTTGPGPSLLGLHEIAAERVAGLSAEEYVRESILNPNDYVVAGYSENFMFQNYGRQLSEEEIDALVIYVLALQASSD